MPSADSGTKTSSGCAADGLGSGSFAAMYMASADSSESSARITASSRLSPSVIASGTSRKVTVKPPSGSGVRIAGYARIRSSLQPELLFDCRDRAGLQFLAVAVHRQNGSAPVQHHPEVAALGGLERCALPLQPPLEFGARHQVNIYVHSRVRQAAKGPSGHVAARRGSRAR